MDRLKALSVLVAESDAVVAIDLADALQGVEAKVIGPVSSVEGAHALLKNHAVDAGILDVTLNGRMVFPVADALLGRGVPFVFYTGYSPDRIPAEYARVPRCAKPAAAQTVLQMLADATSSGPARP